MMLGYAMNARTEVARRGLKRAMTLRSTAAGLQSERDASLVVGKGLRFFTTHACMPGHTIEIGHTLLAWL